MKKAVRFLAPVTFALSCALTYGLFLLLLKESIDVVGAVLGLILGIFVEVGLPIFLTVFVAPIYSVFYARQLKGSRYSLLFSLYSALISSLALAFFLRENDRVLTYALLLFVWMTVWSAAPLLLSPKR